MQTSLSPSVCRAFLGCQIEKAVDELNLTKKIISCHPSNLPLPDHADCFFSRTQEHAPDEGRLIYFPNTFSIFPTFFSTLPALCSALPSASKSGLFVTLPAFFLTLPFTS